MIANNVSGAIYQLPICQFSSFGKMSNETTSLKYDVLVGKFTQLTGVISMCTFPFVNFT